MAESNAPSPTPTSAGVDLRRLVPADKQLRARAFAALLRDLLRMQGGH